MDPSWIDILPSLERQKIRERPKRTREEYAEGREKVRKQHERIREDREKNERTAEVLLYIETYEETLKEKLAAEKLENVAGMLQNYDAKQWGQMQKAFSQHQFDLSVATDNSGEPHISMTIDLPEGNAKETLPLAPKLQEALIARAMVTAE
ncbi:MAG: hypothetical protein AAB853_04490 [Patescibacteria group bacterium]